ncbi:MAG: hypothetical protein SPI35_05875 [Porphyromonas sp.]|nr:hypothetical protein [Porphyromonas sp.]
MEKKIVTTGNAQQDEKLATALYFINKEAKRFRDLKRAYFDDRHQVISEEVYKAVKELKSETEMFFDARGAYALDKNGARIYGVEELRSLREETEQENSYLEVLIEEEGDEAEDPDTMQPAVDSLKWNNEYLEDLDRIEELFINFGESNMTLFKAREDELYQLKNETLTRLVGENEKELACGMHFFENGDVRFVYEFSGLMFHGRDVSEEFTAEELEDVEELKEISSKNKLEGVMTIEEAEKIIGEFLAD